MAAIGSLPILSQAAAPVGSSLSGELSVSASGAANYSLPLITPPGVIKPSLSINYSSQAGNGPLGMGWSLGGLSQIGRCPRDKTIDGIDDGITSLTANDRLCLDGQRLILKSGSAYGADGAEYRTQIESFTKIVGYGDFGSASSWFKVWKKSGEVIEFGNSVDSRVLVTPSGSATSLPYAWSLSKVSDRFSNYYTVSYIQDSNVSYPKRIQYSGNANAGSAPARTITFDWGEATVRPDPIPMYLGAGVRPAIRYRLLGVSNDANSARYKLTYTASGAGLSNLTKLQYCPDGGDANCLSVDSQYGYDKDPATGKRMSDPQLVLAAFGANQGWGDMNVHPRQLADVNGDGRPDIVGFFNDGVHVAFGTETGFTAPVNKLTSFGVNAGGWANNNQYPRMVVDINGDGLADIVGFAGDGVYVSLSTGEGFQQPAKWIAAYGVSAGGWSDQNTYPRQLADVDGDGLLDIVGFSSSQVMVALNKQDRFESSPVYSNLNAYGTAAGWSSNEVYPRQVIDMNGDGRADIVGFSSGGVYVSLSGISEYSAPKLWSPDYGYSYSYDLAKCTSGYHYEARWEGQTLTPRFIVDINNDGLPDILGFNITGGWRRGIPPPCNSSFVSQVFSDVSMALNIGGGFDGSVRLGEEFPLQYANDGRVGGKLHAEKLMRSMGSYKFLGDIDFDGAPEIFRTSSATCTQVFSLKGAALLGGQCLLAMDGVMEFSPDHGKGNFSVVGFSSDGTRVVRGLSRSPNQILSLKTDLTESSITYGSLVDTSAYQKGTGSSFPVMDVQVPYQVVTALTNPDGLGGVRKTQYRYGGLRSHFDYGSLGFQWVETMDPATGALEYNEYKQVFPLVGSLYRSQKQRCANVGQIPWGACEVLSQEVSDWQSSEAGATADRKVYQPYIRKTTESSWVKASP
ncbi:FG-GAP-like repeat-containing protein [Pseudomonas tohonis]|uniref:FG-GAP-like repeat-containing protein n=1 Tax=Pseudomonas tohonis TaxID=2725477 RepID=UPI0021D9CAA3|nr:FG-GAP-like repeat-containing protein [Pseudomonas tohonis]UXY50783.1 FG-GAP-like repeat-containing protein [Pseudomonas tohonis]